ncbi:hypothetical protein [Rhodanobacter sp. C03]|uniref:hypothetical protein n=1 Tax=Rhodanobacter sp. C03 TaxID=1945858 RepID=UPI0020C59835|nr:hypothetical protein [Rhodanobacter sp. C03]
MEFERQHGRLPGALPVRAPQTETSSPAQPHPSIAEPAQRRSRWLLISAAIICIVWLLWSFGWLRGTDEPETMATTSSTDAADAGSPSQREPTAPSALKLGMDTATVRAIEGDPELQGGDSWEYGPSWVRFENGRVSDWYSSPLRPLKTATAHPAPARD